MSPPPSARADPILALMQAGDLRALDHIAREYGPRLARVALRCCRSPHDAEDAVQNALVQASRSLPTYRGTGSPLAWMATLVARSCYRFNARHAPGVDDDGVEVPCSCAGPEAELERRRLGERLSDALMRLSRTDRLILILASEGWTGPEIAEQFDMTAVAVRNRLKRARQRVRARLVDLDERA